MSKYTIVISKHETKKVKENVYDKDAEKYVDVMVDRDVENDIYTQTIEVDDLDIMPIIRAVNGEGGGE